MDAGKAVGVQLDQVLPPFGPAADKSCAFQRLDVFGHGIEAHLEVSCQVGHAHCAVLRQKRQDGAPRGIASGFQNCRKVCVIISFNHMGELSDSILSVNPSDE